MENLFSGLEEEVKETAPKTKRKANKPRNKSQQYDVISAYVPNMVKMTLDLIAKQNNSNSSKIMAYIMEKIAVECLEKGFENVEYLKGFKDGN